MLRWIPTESFHIIPDTNMMYLLRIRFGVRPVEYLPAVWVCLHNDGRVDVNNDPFHCLCCRQWQRAAIVAHDYYRNDLADICRRLPKISVPAREPVVGGVAGLPDGARGDMRVIVDNQHEYIVDVSLVTAGSVSLVTAHRTHVVAGAGARQREAEKVRKYRQAVRQVGRLVNGRVNPTEFVPFVVESGGRLGVKALAFLDKILEQVFDSESERVEQRRRILRTLSVKFMSRQLWRMTNYFGSLMARVDRRALVRLVD